MHLIRWVSSHLFEYLIAHPLLFIALLIPLVLIFASLIGFYYYKRYFSDSIDKPKTFSKENLKEVTRFALNGPKDETEEIYDKLLWLFIPLFLSILWFFIQNWKTLSSVTQLFKPLN